MLLLMIIFRSARESVYTCLARHAHLSLAAMMVQATCAMEMPLSIGDFMEERDRCRDRSYSSPDPILRDGYFCNTDRRWDFTGKEQEYEVSLAPAFRRALH